MPAPGEPTVTVLLRHGQTPMSVEKRYAGTSDVPLTEVGVRQGQTILIVSHVPPIKTLVTSALLAPPPALYRMHLDVAALCEIDWYSDGPAVLRSFNDTGHLTQEPPAPLP